MKDLQPGVREFADDFARLLSAKFPSQIDSITLAGSASRGDFVHGHSDIDIVIRAKDAADVAAMRSFASEKYWQLDEKHGLGLRGVFERKSRGRETGPPVKIFVPGRTPPPTIFSLLDPIHGFSRELYLHAKIHGRVIYGKKFEYPIKEGPWESIFTYSFFLSVLAVPLFFFDSRRALDRSTRAMLFTYEHHLAGAGSSDQRMARKLQRMKIDLDSIQEKWPYFSRASFCVRAPFAIIRKNISGYRARKAVEPPTDRIGKT